MTQKHILDLELRVSAYQRLLARIVYYNEATEDFKAEGHKSIGLSELKTLHGEEKAKLLLPKLFPERRAN